MGPEKTPLASPGDRDADLARHFQRMRAEDGRDAPAFPVEDAGAVRVRVLSLRLQGALATGAVAACLLVVAGLLVTERVGTEDPAMLYADTMSAFALETDGFLWVSDSVSPGLLGLPMELDPMQAAIEPEVLN